MRDWGMGNENYRRRPRLRIPSPHSNYSPLTI
jgi:hypothetical protein